MAVALLGRFKQMQCFKRLKFSGYHSMLQAVHVKLQAQLITKISKILIWLSG